MAKHFCTVLYALLILSWTFSVEGKHFAKETWISCVSRVSQEAVKLQQ